MGVSSHARLTSFTRRCTTIAQLAVSVSSVGLGAFATAQAASDEQQIKTLEEVIVTAQKREQRLQDVPISIAVLSGVDLDRSAEGVTEELNRVPGVTTLTFGSFGTTQVTVRGVTAAAATLTGTSPIGYYLDSVPFGLVRSAISPDANAYDLERVEVLRGPQGTLYGASSANGVVRVLTKNAGLDDFELKARAAGSSTKDGGENYRGDMAVNVPIVEGKLAARAVFGYEDLSGWIDRVNRKDANTTEQKNARLKVNAEPTDQLSIGLSAWLSRSDLGALSNGLENRTNISRIDEPVETDYDTFGLQLAYEFPGFTLSSATSYLDYQNKSKVDYVALFGPALAGNVLNTSFDSSVLAQEINLNSTGEGPWRWTAGAIYRDAEDKFFQWRLAYVNPNGNRSNDTSESYAVFGELTRLFAEGRVELTGGLRYFEDKQVMQEISRLSQIVPNPAYFRREATFDAVSPRVILSWHPRQDFTAYASYAEGFRSGFSQLSVVLSQVPQFPPVEPDNLTNYEIGTKGILWNGRVNFDAAVYYIDWQDVQQSLSVLVNSGAGTALNVSAPINGESASGLGFEVGFDVNLVSGLSFGLSYSWNDLAMDADVISSTGAVLFREGDRLSLSPAETVAASLDYTFPVGSGGYEMRLSASANYISELETRATVAGATVVAKGDAMTTSRASLTLDSPHRWSVTLYGDNLNDESGTPYASVVPTQSIRLRPRTVGAQLEYRF